MKTIFDKEIEEKLHKDLMKLKRKQTIKETLKMTKEINKKEVNLELNINPKEKYCETLTDNTQRSKFINLVTDSETNRKSIKNEDDRSKISDIFKKDTSNNYIASLTESNVDNQFRTNYKSSVLNTFSDSIDDEKRIKYTPVVRPRGAFNPNIHKFNKLYQDYKQNNYQSNQSLQSINLTTNPNVSNTQTYTQQTPIQQKSTMINTLNDAYMSDQAQKVRNTLKRQLTNRLPSINKSKLNISVKSLLNSPKKDEKSDRSHKKLIENLTSEDSNNFIIDLPNIKDKKKITNIVNNLNPTKNDKKVEINFNQYEIKIIPQKKKNKHKEENLSNSNLNDISYDEKFKNKIEKKLSLKKQKTMPTRIIINNAKSKTFLLNLNNKEDLENLNIALNNAQKDRKKENIKIKINRKETLTNKNTKDNDLSNNSSESSVEMGKICRESILKKMIMIKDETKDNKNCKTDESYTPSESDTDKSQNGVEINFIDDTNRDNIVSSQNNSIEEKDNVENKKYINKPYQKNFIKQLTKISELSNLISREYENESYVSKDSPLTNQLKNKYDSNDDLEKKKSKFVNIFDLGKLELDAIEKSSDKKMDLNLISHNSEEDIILIENDKESIDNDDAIIKDKFTHSLLKQETLILNDQESFYNRSNTLKSNQNIFNNDDDDNSQYEIEFNSSNYIDNLNYKQVSRKSTNKTINLSQNEISKIHRRNSFTKNNLSPIKKQNPPSKYSLINRSNSIKNNNLIGKISSSLNTSLNRQRSNSFLITDFKLNNLITDKYSDPDIYLSKLERIIKSDKIDISDKANNYILIKCKEKLQENFNQKKLGNLFKNIKTGFAEIYLKDYIYQSNLKEEEETNFYNFDQNIKVKLDSNYADFLNKNYFQFDYLEKKSFIENYIVKDFDNKKRITLIKNFKLIKRNYSSYLKTINMIKYNPQNIMKSSMKTLTHGNKFKEFVNKNFSRQKTFVPNDISEKENIGFFPEDANNNNQFLVDLDNKNLMHLNRFLALDIHETLEQDFHPFFLLKEIKEDLKEDVEFQDLNFTHKNRSHLKKRSLKLGAIQAVNSQLETSLRDMSMTRKENSVTQISPHKHHSLSSLKEEEDLDLVFNKNLKEKFNSMKNIIKKNSNRTRRMIKKDNENQNNNISNLFPQKYSILSNIESFYETNQNFYIQISKDSKWKDFQNLIKERKLNLPKSSLKFSSNTRDKSEVSDEIIKQRRGIMNKESMLFRTHEIKSNMMKQTENDPKKSLFFYIKDDNFQKFKEILEKKKMPVESTDGEGNSLLNLAVQCSSYDIVDYLINSNSDINSQNHKLNTPLHYALSHKNFKIADLLIKRHADENIKNLANLTPWQCIINTESIL